jgi:hypothetical protein
MLGGNVKLREDDDKTKMLSTDSDSSSRYAAKYSVAALRPCVVATHSPTAIPSPTHRVTHAMCRDDEASASVRGRAADRSGSGVVLTIGGMLTTSLVWRHGRALLLEEFSLQEGVECFLDDSAVFRGSAETLYAGPW